MVNPEIALLLGIATSEDHLAISLKIDECLQVAEQKFGRKLIKPTVVYDLKGATAGRYVVRENLIRLNLNLLHRYQSEMINQTVPHEVAHAVVCQLWPNDREWHGRRWQFIMTLFGCEPERTHNYEVKKVRNHRYYEYECDCAERTYRISQTRHNRIIRDPQAYYCKYCKGFLRRR